MSQKEDRARVFSEVLVRSIQAWIGISEVIVEG